MTKNLILVYPPKISRGFNCDVSLALLYLAGAARDSGVCDNISIFDFNAPSGVGKTLCDLVDIIKSREGTTVIGINCLYSALFPSVSEIAETLKKKFPEIKIVIGGMHPTLFAEEIIDNCQEIDAVAIGESDIDFPKLLRYFYEGGNIDDLEGFCLRIDGETETRLRTNYIRDLDALPRPGYEFYNFQEYAVDTGKWWSPDGIKISPFKLPLLTSRSCPNRCNFCAMRLVMGDRFRERSAEKVFEEIKHLYDTFGVNYFIVEDDNLTFNRKRIVKICEMIIESGIKVYFDAQGGISIKTLDSEVIGLMRRAGFIMVSLAAESGSDYIRNEIMGKHVEREKIINAFKMCCAVGINVNAVFIIGMPEETEGTLKETADLIREIDTTRIAVNVAKPLPGTKLFEQCVRDNLLVGGFNADTLWTGEAELNNMKKDEWYMKHLLNHSSRQFWIKPYNLSIERLMEIDVELQHIAYEKTKLWVEHMRKNNISCE